MAFGVVIENATAGSGNDTLIGNDQNNVLNGGLGNDTIQGGAGSDTAVFSGNKSAYSWSKAGDIVTVTGTDGVDTLSAVEFLKFADRTVDLNAGPTVYRFYNTQKGTHFYTSSAQERDAVVSTLQTYAYEGEAFNSTAEGSSVWRFYNSAANTHFYTISDAERDWVMAAIPTMVYEGEAYKASAAAQSGLDPLFRFYNTQTGAHFYTASAAEADAIEVSLPQFHREGVAFYIDL